MSDLVFMVRGNESMNVPPAKVQEYLDAGWKELSRALMTGSTEAPVSAETPSEAIPAPLTEEKSVKGKRK
jgi:hypothetical protein